MVYKLLATLRSTLNVSKFAKVSCRTHTSVVKLELVVKDHEHEDGTTTSSQVSISMSKILQDLLKKPMFLKDPSRTNEFLHFFSLNVKNYISNELETIQTLLRSGQSLKDNQFMQLTKFCKQAGYRVMESAEINAVTASKYINGFKICIKSPQYQFINLFVTNEEVFQEQKTSYLSSFNIFKNLSAEETDAILLCKMKTKNEFVFKSFKNLPYHELLNILPQIKVLEPAVYKIGFITTLGLSLGSLSSYIISEILYQPSNLYVTIFATSTLLSCLFWTFIKNLHIKHLAYRCDFLGRTKFAEGNDQLQILARRIFPKYFIESLLVYVYLLKENDRLRKEKYEYVEICASQKSNIAYWMKKELGFKLWESFDLDNSLNILQDLKMIEQRNDSLIHYKIHDLETSSSSLISDHFKSPVTSRFN